MPFKSIVFLHIIKPFYATKMNVRRIYGQFILISVVIPTLCALINKDLNMSQDNFVGCYTIYGYTMYGYILREVAGTTAILFCFVPKQIFLPYSSLSDLKMVWCSFWLCFSHMWNGQFALWIWQEYPSFQKICVISLDHYCLLAIMSFSHIIDFYISTTLIF